MDDEGASGALAGAVAAALRTVTGLSQVAEGAPVQGADATAVVEIGSETDWGHKSGAGAELRLAVRIDAAGERPERVRALMQRTRAAVVAMPAEAGAWRVVTLVMQRARLVRTGAAQWAAVIDYRARMLAGRPADE